MSDRLNTKTETISISLPAWLIDILDQVCEKHDFSRSNFVKRATRKYLFLKMDDPELWLRIHHDVMNGTDKE
jgi:Arc/MetJ-type ribon-helix-helix transcriptional regulator